MKFVGGFTVSDTVARTRQINFLVFNEENRDNKSKTGAAVVPSIVQHRGYAFERNVTGMTGNTVRVRAPRKCSCNCSWRLQWAPNNSHCSNAVAPLQESTRYLEHSANYFSLMNFTIILMYLKSDQK